MKRTNKQKAKYLLASLALGSVLVCGPVSAATWNVDQDDPACDDIAGTPFCSIQAAADAASDGDTVSIGAGIYNENIVVNNMGLIFEGAGPDETIVDGGGISGVFSFVSATDENVTLAGLTVRNGNQATGAGVSLLAGSLTLQNCEITDNNATAAGGGVFFGTGTLSITDCNITGNDAVGGTGGGIYHTSGTTTLTRTHIDENLATNAGGIANTNGRLTLTDSTIDHNSAINAVGGLYIVNGALTLTNSSVSGNQASGAVGGATNMNGNVTVTNSTINDNESGNTAGGLYAANGTVIISTSSVNHNSATSGAGIMHPTGTLTITDSTIDDNTASTGMGGGIYHGTGDINISNSSVSNNTAQVIGGLYQTNGTLEIDHSSIDNNSTTTGAIGGIYHTSGDLSISNSSVSQNNAATICGGIYHAAGTAVLTNSTVSENTAGQDIGGIYSLDDFVAVNTTISSNTAAAHVGGAYFVGTARLYNVTVTNNTADSDTDGTGDAGGILQAAGSVTVYNSIIAGNTDTGNEAPDCQGNLTSGGYNIVGNNTGCTFTSDTGDLVGTTATPIDPLLAVLADNGGENETHALQTGSPATDAGNPAGCDNQFGALLTTDQRGFARPSGAACDMGAFEVGTCGDSYVDDGETCDDGNGDNDDSCTNLCVPAACGDGIVQTGVEICDDGNALDGDGCSASCETEEPASTSEDAPDTGTTATPSTGSAAASSGGGCSLVIADNIGQSSQLWAMLVAGLGLLAQARTRSTKK